MIAAGDKPMPFTQKLKVYLFIIGLQYGPVHGLVIGGSGLWLEDYWFTSQPCGVLRKHQRKVQPSPKEYELFIVFGFGKSLGNTTRLWNKSHTVYVVKIVIENVNSPFTAVIEP